MTAPSREDAVRAVAEALLDHYASGYFCRCGAEVNSVAEHMAEAAVAAAEPIIRAAIAAEIRAQRCDFDHADAMAVSLCAANGLGLDAAARIAEGTP